MVNGQPQYYGNYSNYQPYPQTMPIVQQPSQIIPNQILAWVQSEEEAMKFPLSTGQSIFLMNQNDNYLYMKSVDQLGKTTFIKKRLVDETERNEEKVDLSGFIRKEELSLLITEMVQKEVEKRVSEIQFKPTKPRKRAAS